MCLRTNAAHAPLARSGGPPISRSGAPSRGPLPRDQIAPGVLRKACRFFAELPRLAGSLFPQGSRQVFIAIL
jgi:hypothetical protein